MSTPRSMTHTRTFQAATLTEAMRVVRRALGSEAIILGTREVREPRSGRVRHFEVTASGALQEAPAATPAGEPVAPAAVPLDPLIDAQPTTSPPAPVAEPAASGWRVEPPPGPAPDGPALHDLQTGLQALQAEVATLARAVRGLSPPARGIEDLAVQRLVAAGVERVIADAIVQTARQRVAPDHGLAVARPPDLTAELVAAVGRARPIWQSPPGAVCAIVGACGVGKTRTLVKLAALSTFVHNRRVGIVTTDVHRIGGLAPLESFCEILGLPVRRAGDRAELRAALESLDDHDLVLIDTPGASPRDGSTLGYLTELLGSVSARVHLAVAATTRVDDVRTLTDRLALGRVDSVLVTKLDEARGPGAALSASVGVGRPISHLCAGQEIPDDCEAIDPAAFADRVLHHAA